MKNKQADTNKDNDIVIFLCGKKHSSESKPENRKKLLDIAQKMFKEDFDEKEEEHGGKSKRKHGSSTAGSGI